MLGAIKVDFGRFGVALEATQKKLSEATDNLGKAAKRTEIIQNKLRSVEELPETEAADLLGEPLLLCFSNDPSLVRLSPSVSSPVCPPTPPQR